ncbi:MAG: TrkH family potassium uptake protein [Betaproteobacteria bacterium]|nr:TrkH family potassium uptake protein [Betaproteobacteria bacterium]
MRDGFFLVVLIWTLFPAMAALPLMAALPDLSFSHAYFEAASGLTATGATVLSGIDFLPPSVNFWRGEMIWLGGMGLIVLVTAILPVIGGGAAMMQSELPGPAKDERLMPQIAQTAKTLWLTYAALTAACAVAYYFAGMNSFDAVMHAFTTLGLGGFSSHDASYAYFDSPLIEAVAVVFMAAAGMNFVLHFLAWRRKTARLYWSNLECRAYLLSLAAATAVVVCYLRFSGVYSGWADAARYGIFNAVSVITTTGYSNADYNAWPLFAPLLMLVLANFISCGGSTGGGVKMQRVLIAVYQTGTETQKHLHPRAYYNNKAAPAMPQKQIVSVLFFILAYGGTALALMLALSAAGLDFKTAFSAALATLSNTGPGLGEVGPASNYGGLTAPQTWLCAAAMLVGRLELLSFFILLRRSFWTY